MKSHVLILFLLLTIVGVNAQQVIVVQGVTKTSAYPTIAAAVEAAQNGDYVYIPGGIFAEENITITKQLNIIGAGHYPDSTKATGRTVINGSIIFNNGSDYSTIQGIYVNNAIQIGTTCELAKVKNILISRCNVGSIRLAASNSGTTCGARYINIRECIIRNTFIVSMTQDVLVENSIINCTIRDVNGNVQFKNCNIIIPLDRNHFIYNVNSCKFTNCIFNTVNQNYVDYSTQYPNTFENCTMPNVWAGINTYINCKFNVHPDSIFVNTKIENFQYTHDYHLRPNSQAKGAGTNGTDCGIYGGENPYKEGAVPMNPHIWYKNIPNITDNQGKLNIKIGVTAQEK